MPFRFTELLQNALDFSRVLNTSIAASWLILAVLLLRILLKKAPKWIHVTLWGIVALRLLLPLSIESIFSLIPSAETVPTELLSYQGVQLQEPAHLDLVSNPTFAGGVSVELSQSVDRMQFRMMNLTWLWLAGAGVMILYTLFTYLKLRLRVRTAVRLQDKLYQSEEVISPFVLGLFRPRIYLPFGLDSAALSHVISHEQAHIRRRDHWWKPLGFLLLSLHWFNPLMWLAYILLCRDIERACDEKVIRELDADARADYSQALLRCSVNRRLVAACPLAFGEVSVKERVVSVLNYKKPAFWLIIVSAVACIVVALCFLTNPKPPTDFLRLTERHGGSLVQYDVSLGQQAKSGTVYAEYWNHGDCIRSTPLSMTRYVDEIQIQTSVRRENDRIVGADVQITTNQYGGSLLTYFPLPADDPALGWGFSAHEMKEKIKVAPESEVILAAMAFDKGNGIRVFDCVTLALEPEWLANYDDIIVVRAVFSAEDLAPQTHEPVPTPEEIAPPQSYEPQATPTEPLTLDKLIALSRLGDKLSWSDFDSYAYVETGSGFYIRVYEIDESFSLWLSGSASPDSEPTYFYLRALDGSDDFIDIRYGGVEEFIAEHSTTPLQDAIIAAILDAHEPKDPDGLYHCASFVQLESELSEDGAITVYGLAMHMSFGYAGGTFHNVGGSHIPTAITFEIQDGEYVLKEYWASRDGNRYEPSIREKFPDSIEEDAMDTQKYVLAQIQNCYDQAVRFGSVDTVSAIEYLLEVIESSPAEASNPAAYINEHPIEYRELKYYGSYTLQHCFTRFLEGNQTGLRGHIMASACSEIALGWGEALLIDWANPETATGQDWFDIFLHNAKTLSAQYSTEELEARYPASFLLLQMIA